MTSHQTFLSHKRKTQHKSYYYTLARSHENYAPFLLSTTAKILYLELNFLFHGYKPSKRKEGKKKHSRLEKVELHTCLCNKVVADIHA